MRPNSSSELWMSTPVLSSWTAGRKRLCWRVVNATSVPIEIAMWSPWPVSPVTR